MANIAEQLIANPPLVLPKGLSDEIIEEIIRLSGKRKGARGGGFPPDTSDSVKNLTNLCLKRLKQRKDTSTRDPEKVREKEKRHTERKLERMRQDPDYRRRCYEQANASHKRARMEGRAPELTSDQRKRKVNQTLEKRAKLKQTDPDGYHSWRQEENLKTQQRYADAVAQNPDAVRAKQVEKNNNYKEKIGGRVIQEKRKESENYAWNCVQIHARAYDLEIEFDAIWLSEYLKHNPACFYCGCQDERLGVDRVISDVAYLYLNIVPACATCNYMKWVLPHDYFINLAHIIFRYRETKQPHPLVKEYAYRAGNISYRAIFLPSAKRRSLEVHPDFTQKVWQAMVMKPCYLCGCSEARGIDRVDNNLGYIKSNCRPCCYSCNRMKKTFTYLDFMHKVRKIVALHSFFNSCEPRVGIQNIRNILTSSAPCKKLTGSQRPPSKFIIVCPGCNVNKNAKYYPPDSEICLACTCRQRTSQDSPETQ